jgi:hypothetical protein
MRIPFAIERCQVAEAVEVHAGRESVQSRRPPLVLEVTRTTLSRRLASIQLRQMVRPVATAVVHRRFQQPAAATSSGQSVVPPVKRTTVSLRRAIAAARVVRDLSDLRASIRTTFPASRSEERGVWHPDRERKVLMSSHRLNGIVYCPLSPLPTRAVCVPM